MESGRGSAGGIRSGQGGKKMRKRKELDALVGGVSGAKRGVGNKRAGSGGISPQDQLLSESTGEEEYWSNKGGKGRRRYIGSAGNHQGRPCQTLLRTCTVLLFMACLVATLTVMWLFIDIREQTAYLHNQLEQVAAGSQGVPDALQKCHSLSKELQNNQTKLFTQLSALSHQLTNFTVQIANVQGGLANVQRKLMSSPELVNVPHDLQALSESVASFGSQIQDLQTTSNHWKEEHTTIIESLKNIQLNISKLDETLFEFSNKPLNSTLSINSDVIEEEKKLESLVIALQRNVSSINETLSHDLHWVKVDQQEDNKHIDQLRELGANASSQISTIQNVLSNQKKKIRDMEEHVYNFTHEVEHFVTQGNVQYNQINERLKKLENHNTEELSFKGFPHDAGDQNLTSSFSHRMNDSSIDTSSTDHRAINLE